MKTKKNILMFVIFLSLTGYVFAAGVGESCTTNGDCTTNYCRSAIIPINKYCAQDSTSCVDQQGGTTYQYTSGSFGPLCTSYGSGATAGSRYRCDSGSWTGSVTCETGYTVIGRCYAARTFYCTDSSSPTAAMCESNVLYANAGYVFRTGSDTTSYNPDSTYYCDQYINCASLGNCQAAIYSRGCQGDSISICTETNKQVVNYYNAPAGNTISETNYKEGTTCSYSTGTYCSGTVYCNGAGGCATTTTAAPTTTTTTTTTTIPCSVVGCGSACEAYCWSQVNLSAPEPNGCNDVSEGSACVASCPVCSTTTTTTTTTSTVATTTTTIPSVLCPLNVTFINVPDNALLGFGVPFTVYAISTPNCTAPGEYPNSTCIFKTFFADYNITYVGTLLEYNSSDIVGAYYQITYIFNYPQIYSYSAECWAGTEYEYGVSGVKTIKVTGTVVSTTLNVTTTTYPVPMSSWNCSNMVHQCISGNLKTCVVCPFYTTMGAWFMVVLLIIVCVLVYFKTQTIAAPLVINLVVVGSFWNYFPYEFWIAESLAVIMAIVGLLYVTSKG